MGRVILWLPLLLLVGCQPLVVDEARWFRPPEGTEVVVRMPLTVPPDAARVFLQGGEAMAWGEVRQLKPHCHFEVSEVWETAQTIQPGTFRIANVSWGYEQVVHYGPRLVASVEVMAQNVDDGGLPPIARFVRMNLESAAQPNVRRLTCHGRFQDWDEAEEPSPAEIRQALGDKVRIAGL